MKFRRIKQAWCVAGLVLAVSAVTRAEDIKQIRPTGYVVDLAGIVKPQAKVQLEALCGELEQKTGAQMAIVTVKSLDGNDIDQYAPDLFKHLGIGSKKDERGVLLLIAPNDRKYRAEIGYGLEPVINDARAGDAGRLMVPYFRQGDYSGGVAAAAWKLAQYVADDKGVKLSGAPPARPVRSPDEIISHRAILALFAFLIFFTVLRTALGLFSGPGPMRPGGGGWWIGPGPGGWGGGGGGWSGGGGWGGGGGGGGGGGFGGFGGGESGGGGASGSW